MNKVKAGLSPLGDAYDSIPSEENIDVQGLPVGVFSEEMPTVSISGEYKSAKVILRTYSLEHRLTRFNAYYLPVLRKKALSIMRALGF